MITLRPIGLTFIALSLSLPALADTSGQAHVKATKFLRVQAAGGFEGWEAQAVLLGEAIAADPLAAGPRATSLLASLELGSVDARARRARTLGELLLTVEADKTAIVNQRTPFFGYGVNRDHLPTPLDTALAIQALDIAPKVTGQPVNHALNDLVSHQDGGGMWPLLRAPDAAGGGAGGSVAATAQAAIVLSTRTSLVGDFDDAIDALRAASPTPASDRALRLLALMTKSPVPSETSAALTQLVAMQQSDGSFGSEAAAADRVYATALVARALLRSSALPGFGFDSDGDATPDSTDPDDDNDGVCDGPPGAGCTGTDAFPTDPAESADLDQDGIGNVADKDDDGDGILDVNEPGYGTDAQERVDTDGDGTADTADQDDDGDGAEDIEELLAGLDPRKIDTDGDSFRDDRELAAQTDGANAAVHPKPDGDIFPLGAPDWVVDDRDVLLATRIASGAVTVPPESQTVFRRHADVAPLVAGLPSVDGNFDHRDLLVLIRRAYGLEPAWQQ